jgi:nucleoside-diphosphate-sugar epimerase
MPNGLSGKGMGDPTAEASNLMGQEWRFSSRRAREELGYETRPLDDTLRATIDWYSS